MRSPILQVFNQLLRSPDVPVEKMFVRIRLMERDIMLPVKMVTLTVLYFFLPDYAHFLPEDLPTEDLNESNELFMAQLTAQTVRTAFIGYVFLNILAGACFVAMASLPARLIGIAVYVAVIADAIFAAVLVHLTGDIESLFYWVFLLIIVRSAISVSRHREQLVLYAIIVVCYILGPVFGRTFENIADQLEPQTILPVVVPADQASGTNELAMLSNKVVNTYVEYLADTNITAKPTQDGNIAIENEELSLIELVLTSILQVTEPEEWQEKFVRIVVLGLLSVCCYGINVLWNFQVLTREEEQEFATREYQLRSTGRLAAEIAHQIKNPLAIINNAAFSLGRALKDSPEKVHDKIRMIQEEVDRSDQILTQLMGYAKLAEGKVERLNLHNELERAVEQVFPRAFDQKVKIYIECPEEFPPMLMQQGHLNEILVNLLANAREALNNEGFVEINAVESPNKQVVLTVLDNGPGVPSERLEKVFEPYFSTKATGTGLGLAIVKHNVEMYGGTVSAESGLGNGTKFTLVFPFKVIVPVDK